MAERDFRQRKAVQCHTSASKGFNNTNGGVLRNSCPLEHDKKRGTKCRLTKVMTFSLLVKLAVASVVTYELSLQWPLDMFGSNVGPHSVSLPDKDIPTFDEMKSNMQEEHEETVTKSMRSFPPADVIESNLNNEHIEKPVKRGLRRSGAPHEGKSITTEEHTASRVRSISHIDKDYPSADVIKSILTEEHQMVSDNTLSIGNERPTIADMAAVYELVYAFIAAFQREDIPIFAGFGSHLGARRHHGIIPFSEKDIDLQVFSVNERQVTTIVRSVLKSNASWSSILVETDEFGFGYRLNKESMAKHGLKYYIEFWLFDSDVGRDKNVMCVGRNIHPGNAARTGCLKSYMYYAGKRPPKFEYSDYFPPLYQVFGSHKVPIPRTSKELETFDYNIAEEHWNTTCGMHRYYDYVSRKWVPVPKEERECSKLYDKYPFVFKTGDGAEVLRQGDFVIHKSEIEA